MNGEGLVLRVTSRTEYEVAKATFLTPLNRPLLADRAKKSAESKAHKRPNLPCAWYFALYRFSERESQLH
jgi:hypothetical protein